MEQFKSARKEVGEIPMTLFSGAVIKTIEKRDLTK